MGGGELGRLNRGSVGALRRSGIGGFEYMDLAEDRLTHIVLERAIAIAAASGLNDRIVRAEGAPDGGEIHVHASLNALG